MSELRSNWKPQQVQESLSAANESLPEARTIDRFPVRGRAGGMDLLSGEEMYEEVSADESGGVLRVPPDPPQRPTDQGGL